jgi:cytochrome P450 family 710 subfamily A protein
MVSNAAGRDVKVTEAATEPRGSVVAPVFPSFAANMQGFPEPERFDPDRMDPNGRAEDIRFRANFMTFGCGPHLCVGREYAINHLVAFMSILAASCTWTRRKDGEEHKILYLPTLYPASCLIALKYKAAAIAGALNAGAGAAAAASVADGVGVVAAADVALPGAGTGL